MNDFNPKTPIILQIRKIIFEKFNSVDIKFTNDEIFEILKKNGDIDSAWIVDNTDSYFKDICSSGFVRNIAQNFTTIWMKLFYPAEKLYCNACKQDIYLGEQEDRVCPNQDCKAAI